MRTSRTCAGLLALLWLAGSTSLDGRAQSGSDRPPPARPPQVATDRLALQVALDRAGFSVGVIDGRLGRLTALALQRFQEARGLPATGSLDAAAREALPTDPPVLDYTLTADDVKGPWTAIPDDMMEKRTLEALGYASPLEAIAERFHASPRLIRQLNPGVAWEAGTVVHVPNVEPFVPPARTQTRKVDPPEASAVADVRVSRAGGSLIVRGTDGRVLFAAPVTSGSEHDPLPIGAWKVTAVYLRPVFHYNPALFWDADPSHAKAKLAAGPNNPVGVVWIDLDKEHYGLHGTPEPERIGATTSHGCVRLTNWDASRVAALVRTGTPVLFEP